MLTRPTLDQFLSALVDSGLPLPPVCGAAPDDPPAPPPRPEPVPDLGKIVEAAVAKHGDQTGALKAFAADLYAARDDLKAARAKIPGDGSIVLTGDDAKDYGAYRTIGKPSDLRKTVEEHAALAAENATFKRDAELRGVAEKAGVKFAVLKTLAPAHLAFESKAVKDPKTGKDAEVLHVKDGEALTPFDDYAAKNWADFLPALRLSAKAAEPARQPGTPPRHDLNRPPAPPTPADPAAANGVRRPLDPGQKLLAAIRF